MQMMNKSLHKIKGIIDLILKLCKSREEALKNEIKILKENIKTYLDNHSNVFKCINDEIKNLMIVK